MDFFDLVEKRRSIRKFSNKRIPEEVIIKALKAGLLAANSSNLQPWEFYWVKNRKNKAHLITKQAQNFLSKERKTKANKAKERFYDPSGRMTRKTKDKRGKQKITTYEDGKITKTKVNKRTGKVKVKTRQRGQIFAKKS